MKIDESNNLGVLVHTAARLMRRRFDQRASDLGLSSAQWRLLVHVMLLDQPTQARLAERLEVEPISVSRLLDRMEEQGWVRREPDPTDRRSKIVLATEKTHAAWVDTRHVSEAIFEEALAGIDAAGRAALMAGLTQIIRNLTDTPEPGTSHEP